MRAGRLYGTESVHGHVARICFKTGPPTRVGAELELLLAGPDPRQHISLRRLRAALVRTPAPGGSRLTFEPGGQVELSSLAATGLTALVTNLQSDLDALLAGIDSAGLRVLDLAADPCRPPRRQLSSPRYDAMEAYFDSLETAVPVHDRVGRLMMASTAATQVNLDIGTDPAARWRLLHDLGPVLIAAFANSPLHAGRRTGWKSTRQRIWQSLDPARTAPPVGEDPVAAYSELALGARVMMPAGRGTLRDWVEASEPPTTDDLELHLTTLFPPVRPRGWFEVRYVDAQPLRWWPVPIAVLSALLDDPTAADLAAEAAEPARGCWATAARCGLEDPVLARAALRCFEIAVDSLGRHDPLLVELVADFADQHTARGRCPADEERTRVS